MHEQHGDARDPRSADSAHDGRGSGWWFEPSHHRLFTPRGDFDHLERQVFGELCRS
jgi:hypothetical protein